MRFREMLPPEEKPDVAIRVSSMDIGRGEDDVEHLTKGSRRR